LITNLTYSPFRKKLYNYASNILFFEQKNTNIPTIL
jgi:hypothetical protein